MAKRRTKQAKVVAKLRKQIEIAKPIVDSGLKNTVSPKHFYQPELSLPTKLLQRDLVRTLLVTAVALGLQIGLYMYLKQGGWQVISKFWERG